MIYKAIIYYDQVAFYAILPGRFFHLWLNMSRVHDFYCVY